MSIPKPPTIPGWPGMPADPKVAVQRIAADQQGRDIVHALGAELTPILPLLLNVVEVPPDAYNPEAYEPTRMRRLTRANLNAWKVRQLKVEQGGLCALCGKPVDLKEAREGAVDHNHDTGEVRGVLHRSCNAAEGKIANAAGAWGAKSMQYKDIVPFVEKLVAYWRKPGCGVIYPTHKSAEESANIKRNKRNQQAKERRAAQKAQRVLRDRKEAP